jgi:hypothetical protein
MGVIVRLGGGAFEQHGVTITEKAVLTAFQTTLKPVWQL